MASLLLGGVYEILAVDELATNLPHAFSGPETPVPQDVKAVPVPTLLTLKPVPGVQLDAFTGVMLTAVAQVVCAFVIPVSDNKMPVVNNSILP